MQEHRDDRACEVVRFFLNGRLVTLQAPSPDLLLIDWLRSPEVGLAGPKKPCGQGGCGGCTVILSRWNGAKARAEHRAINACLRPVVSLQGLVVTTVEGTGAFRKPNPRFLSHAQIASRAAAPVDARPPATLIAAQEKIAAKRDDVESEVKHRTEQPCNAPLRFELLAHVAEAPSEHKHAGINPVAWRLAMNNGTQCGYCTVGFVMNMSEFLGNHPKATKREIEAALDGNLCRCTGYRAILTGMKTFASDWTEEDEAARMKCLPDPDSASQLATEAIIIPFPHEARVPPGGVEVHASEQRWLSPANLDTLVELMREHPHARLVAANTGFGIYKEQYRQHRTLLNLALVPDLHIPAEQGIKALSLPAGISYSDLIAALEKTMAARGEAVPDPEDRQVTSALTRLGAVHFMARRTAGRIVRNAATLGGNIMLALHHIHADTGAPFTSDIVTALVAADASVDYVDTQGAGPVAPRAKGLAALVQACVNDPKRARGLVLLRVHIPYGGTDDLLLPQKIALREVNAHSIVNSTTRLVVDHDLAVQDVSLVFGGIAPFPWRAEHTEAGMRGKRLSLENAAGYALTLEQEARTVRKRWAPRLKEVPSEGFTEEYVLQLAVSCLYKAIVNGLVTRRAEVPPALASAGEITWGRWPVSTGHQAYSSQGWKAPVAQPYITQTAMEQASGQLHYAHELPVPPRTVNAALVQSRCALATWYFRLPEPAEPAWFRIKPAQLRQELARRFPGFVDLITADDLPDGGINFQGMGGDQPLFAPRAQPNEPPPKPDNPKAPRVAYVGQTLALVAAATETEAQAIAAFVADHCVVYGEVTFAGPVPAWWRGPVLTLEDAISKGSIYPDFPEGDGAWNSHIWKITRPGSRFDWADTARDPLDQTRAASDGLPDNAPCKIVSGTQRVGGQIHFYMEPQGVVVEPQDGRRMLVRPSTQSPKEMHQTTAMALGVNYNSIEVQVPPVGGGYGGKTEQTRFVTGVAAVAARAMKRPVRLMLDREQDTALIGKRHAAYGQYQVAIDTGGRNQDDRGVIHGFLNRMWGDGGAFYDCSFIVANCIQSRADNAYMVRNFENQLDICRTNTAPSTAFRSFGDIQCKIITESAIDDAAFAIGMRAEDVREINLYRRGDVTPFGQALSYCYIREVWSFLKEKARFEMRAAEVTAFNKAHRWRKRGVAMLPVKYGSGYNALMLEQAVAVLSIHSGDGSITINQGGVEMGQGLMTVARQVAAYILNVPLELIEIAPVRTSVIPNPTSSGASTGTAYAAEVVKRLAAEMRSRLMAFADGILAEEGPEKCRDVYGIDYWNEPEKGWQAERNNKLIWQNIINQAYLRREPLSLSFSTQVQGGEIPAPALTRKPFEQQPTLPGYKAKQGSPMPFNNFVGFTYSAACATVEIDILTGETKVLSADLAYDAGWSLNPAIDIGQVEGAFVQGLGYVLSEKLVFEPKGDAAGRLNTLNTWTYKLPAAQSIPLEFNTWLFPRDLVSIPVSPTDGVLSSKEVGEPPLVLAASVFLAVKAAVRASRLERGLSGLFRLDAPATVQEVRRACDVQAEGLGILA